MRTPSSSPVRSATSAITCHSGRTPEPLSWSGPFGRPIAGRRRCTRPSGWVIVLLLGVGLGGEDDVGVLADRVREHGVDRDHGLGGAERGLPGGAVGNARSGSAWCSQTVDSSPPASAAAMPAASLAGSASVS